MHSENVVLELPAPRSWIERVWTTIADRGRAFAGVPAAAGAATVSRAVLLANALLSGRGEASGAALARELLAVLRELPGEGRLAFFRHAATHYGPDEERLKRAAAAYLAEATPGGAAELAIASEPVRQELLRRMNFAQGGTASLVAMRSELLGMLRAEPALRPLDDDLRHLLASWFNRGFLELRRIDWNTPAAVLEKLIQYEAVHEIAGWPDLRRRLAADRRCFGFFHPALPGEPLIFVEVALVRGLAGSVQPLLAPAPEGVALAREVRGADTAIFYSISNCQDGLRGISFGNFLIKQVVEELRAELPQLVRFSTLSPVPGFRRWLLEAEISGFPDGFAERAEDAAFWAGGEEAEVFRQPMLRACARFLTDARGGRGPADPVARFHLGNGARLERVNWRGNVSARGVAESFGIMVNYLYDPETIEANHEAFARSGATARGEAVEALLATGKRAARG
jgi:malonyl-CoA decarboxylase